jgi:acyl-CoA dehydrogenase
MSFRQCPPQLGNTYEADRALREQLQRLLPAAVLGEVLGELREMGASAAGALDELGARVEAEPPRLVAYDAWGNRADRVEVSPAWLELHARQARAGLCALPYESRHGEHDRIVQHALYHLYAPSCNVYTCPIAMTDGAARVLCDHASDEMRERVLPRLLAREPERAWTSGQWMTEQAGGSDVANSETVARTLHDGDWRLWGEKWFASSITSQCALTLARPEGAPTGSAGLALFLVELQGTEGTSQLGRTVLVNRLKDKLGTRAVPTAELTLQGARATPVGKLGFGLRKMATMLNVCRLHNAMSAAAVMARVVQLAVSYAGVREAFGRRLIDLPLHRQTLAELAVEAEAALALTLRASELTGRVEHAIASEREELALRALIPVVKLLSAKDAVACVSEGIECFGGAGYVEDTGLPLLLRNAQILPIWEGTTNVLSLDLLPAAQRDECLEALLEDLAGRLVGARSISELSEPLALVQRDRAVLVERAEAWPHSDADAVQVEMRAYAMRLGRCYSASLLIEHAAHRIKRHGDSRAAIVAHRYARRWLCAPLTPVTESGEQSLVLLGCEQAREPLVV